MLRNKNKNNIIILLILLTRSVLAHFVYDDMTVCRPAGMTALGLLDIIDMISTSS